MAPADATVSMIYPTLHAVGLILDNGIEMMIHIGIDTVKLNGQYFEKHVQDGDHVKRGQLLVSFDIQKIEQAGYDLTTTVVVTNSKNYAAIGSTNKDNVTNNDQLLYLLSKS